MDRTDLPKTESGNSGGPALQPADVRRQQRVAARRAQILDAAAHLFAERGFHRTTTRAIAEAASISEGTLYNYFDSKDDLLLGILERLVYSLDLYNRLAEGLPEDPRDFLIGMLRERRVFIERNQVMLQAVLAEVPINPDLRQRYYQELIAPLVSALEKHLEARVALGQIRALDPALAARVLMGLFNGLFLLDLFGDEQTDNRWDELATTAAELLFEGVMPVEKQADRP